MTIIDYKPAFFGSGTYNTGIIATDTDIDLSSITSDINVSSSVIHGPYTINTGSIGIMGGTTNYNYQTPDWQNKRMDVRDNGQIPVDIWAMMYNNGVIDD